MEMWFTEQHTNNVRFSFKVNKQLVSEKSEFQRIDVLDTYEFGKVLTLDGFLMLTEKDEFVYHEMLTHLPLTVNPKIKKVLVIGGGDGGCVRELARHKSIEQITLVEIDKRVVEICQEFLPSTACALTDSRVRLVFEDGLKFIRTCKNEFDLIIVDSTDPFGVGEGLFTKQFYGNCYKALTDDGILVNQLESVFYDEYIYAVRRAKTRLDELFEVSKVYQAHIPTYPSGHWLFGFASKKFNPTENIDFSNFNDLNLKTRYYNPEIHIGAFALPNTVKEAIENAEND